jgi:hypothetical protein
MPVVEKKIEVRLALIDSIDGTKTPIATSSSTKHVGVFAMKHAITYVVTCINDDDPAVIATLIFPQPTANCIILKPDEWQAALASNTTTVIPLEIDVDAKVSNELSTLVLETLVGGNTEEVESQPEPVEATAQPVESFELGEVVEPVAQVSQKKPAVEVVEETPAGEPVKKTRGRPKKKEEPVDIAADVTVEPPAPTPALAPSEVEEEVDLSELSPEQFSAMLAELSGEELAATIVAMGVVTKAQVALFKGKDQAIRAYASAAFKKNAPTAAARS